MIIQCQKNRVHSNRLRHIHCKYLADLFLRGIYISNDCVFPANWTAETLMQKHRSLPHNPDIANTFFRAGFIESWGRGIEKILPTL